MNRPMWCRSFLWPRRCGRSARRLRSKPTRTTGSMPTRPLIVSTSGLCQSERVEYVRGNVGAVTLSEVREILALVLDID